MGTRPLVQVMWAMPGSERRFAPLGRRHGPHNVHLIVEFPNLFIVGCTVVQKKDMLLCMNGTVRYGFLTYRTDDDSKIVTLDMISVEQEHRRKGVATVMLAYLIDNIAKKGKYKMLKLEVMDGREGNPKAVKLYENAGFKFVESSNTWMILNL
ncbi:acetyltransferase (GNAT) family domain-containing protein [Ditylenchus destructor]|uniref:Acetyltransferase (GNAT) family domain-containing protein n=1 Tax=Ditylenchus destructor TaxID=166010 RepID=A0AAD4R4A7_9BILA|nr:acetyltransferase (GNAT) family domain-containing protein [Ditylenchus destructor]